MDKINVAVVGATGLIGSTMIRILEERHFPVNRLYPLASTRSVGKEVIFHNETIPVGDLEQFDFSQVDLAFFSAGGEVSKEYVPKAAAQNCLCIDNTSYFRYDEDVPLVVPEINSEAVALWKNRYIIANPNCSTIQMLVALNPIHKKAKITRINVATYQAVSGAGNLAIDELMSQVRQDEDASYKTDIFPLPIAFNALPHIDVFQENGYTKEEMKIVWETKKILNDQAIQVNPTAVRIPVQTGHSEAVHLETERKITADEVRELLSKAPGVIVKDERAKKGYPTPLCDASGQDAVFVGRIREDISHPRGIDLWVVADNIRKGGALNSIQIAEVWFNQYRKS